MITLRNLSVLRGHSEEIYVTDKGPEERQRLAEDILGLVRKGYSVFLMTGNKLTGRIQSYDPDSNEWLLAASSVSQESGHETTVSEGEQATPQKRASWWQRLAGGGKRSLQRMPADNTKVAAVPQRAGG